MVGGTRIIAFEAGGSPPGTDEFLLSEELREPEAVSLEWAQEEAQAEAEPAPRRAEWLWPTLAVLAVLAWSGFFAWALKSRLPSLAAPEAWPPLVAQWAMPVLLIGLAWLIFMRNSRREAIRFGETARVLSDESALLEKRLLTVNRELSLAREFIAAQARDLDALGRMAVDRLTQNSERLQSLIQDNGARIDSIGTVSEAALDNMEKLRGQLPVIASSAKDVTNTIGHAGRTAAAQLGELVTGLERLNTFGQASERQVQTLRSEVDKALAEFTRQSEHLGEIAASRFAMLGERGAEFRQQLETQEAEALAAIRTRATSLAEEVAHTRQHLDAQEEQSLTSLRARLSALRDEGGALSRAIRDGEARSLDEWRAAVERIDEELHRAVSALGDVETRAVENARSRLDALVRDAGSLEAQLTERGASFEGEMSRRLAALENSDEAAIARLSARLAAFDADIAERRSAHENQSAALAAHSEAIAGTLAEIERRMAEVAARGGAAEASFAASVETLAARFAESRTALAGTDREIAQLTDASVRLLEILQASKHQARDELQDALAISEKRLESFENRVVGLRDAVAEASRHGDDVKTTFGEIEAMQATFGRSSAAHGETLESLRQTLAEIGERSAGLAGQAQDELSQAIERLLASAGQAVAAINDTGTQTVSALAAQLGSESASAIDKAMRTSAAEVAGQLELAAAHAAGVSREAAVQLRDQLGKVNDLVGNLERRVAHARKRAEEQVDNDFSRRAALITESLNSNAIDIAKALSRDVSDTAWSAYLRGDRGIFTRRAVSLIESGEMKAIAQIFENDSDFREHVSRYIHDFEAILRQVLSTRDGHALGVTLLSSDMGKLYVALAQAIERIRN